MSFFVLSMLIFYFTSEIKSKSGFCIFPRQPTKLLDKILPIWPTLAPKCDAARFRDFCLNVAVKMPMPCAVLPESGIFYLKLVEFSATEVGF